MAKLIGIAIKPQGKTEMQELSQSPLSCERGVEGDCRGKPGPRQVTLMSLNDWKAACAELAIERPWTDRRANLLVDEIPLEQTQGRLIQIGDAVLEVTGETDPCHRMEALHPGLFNALAKEWRGGVTCRVVAGGLLKLGEEVTLQDPQAQ